MKDSPAKGRKMIEFPKCCAEIQHYWLQRHNILLHTHTGEPDSNDRERIVGTTLQILFSGITNVRLYPWPKRSPIDYEYLSKQPWARKVRGHYQVHPLPTSLREFAPFFDSKTDPSQPFVSLLVDCDANRIDWEEFFALCFNPAILNNPRSILPAAAVQHGKTRECPMVSIGVFAWSGSFADLLIFDAKTYDNSLLRVVLERCALTDTFVRNKEMREKEIMIEPAGGAYVLPGAGKTSPQR
jgi:hypothetical protein